jgi:DNA-binding CsgD family transcriptional regulator
MPLKRSRGRPPHPDVLTPAEWRVAHAVQHGLTNRQVAALKGVSVNAVKYHLGNVLTTATTPESVLYFRVADIGQAYQELCARGADGVSAPHLIHTHGDGTEEWLAFFRDPDGQLLALHSQVSPLEPPTGLAGTMAE